MKSVVDLISELQARQIKLWVDNKRLRYAAPQGVITDEILDTLRAHKAEIVDFLGQLEGGVDNKIQPVERTGQLPLSFVQRRLWLLHKLDPNTTAYSMPQVFRLEGKLNIEALENSLGAVIERHEVLRTTFREYKGQAEQIIAAPEPIKLPIDDLQTLPIAERENAAKELVAQEVQKPFNLNDQEPLLRQRLLTLTASDHILIVNIHHIVFDGWSANLFYNELFGTYAAFCQGQASPFSSPTIQYVDFANWQHQQATTENFEKQLSYWLQKLGGALPILQLPTDYPRPERQSFQSDSCQLSLSAGLTTQLKSLSQQHNATLFMTLLAAFNVLLYRHTGQDDVIVGTPIAGRSQEVTEQLIGLFLNSLALRTDLSDSPTFGQLLQQVRDATLNAYAHQDVPFEQLVAELNPERSLARHPIFEVMLNFVNLPKTAQEKNLELDVSRIKISDSGSKFTMTLYVREIENQLHFNLVYQTALFKAARMEDFIQQLQRLLEQIVAEPGASIDDYSLVSQAMRAYLPDPAKGVSASEYEPVPSLVQGWGTRAPEQTAICQGADSWTYGELVEKATTIANYLLSQGTKPGDAIAISGLRSFGLIASLLGVLKAGGVLVLIDPQLPAQRRQVMLEAASACCLLWVASDLEPEAQTVPIEQIDPNTAEIAAVTNPAAIAQLQLPTIQPQDPAYIFFTSGTTGIPKGVLGCHKGLAHFLSWQRQTFEIGASDRIAQLTALSFDVVLRDIFLPLSSGATLCLPAPEADLSAAQVLPWLSQQHITVLHTVPTLAQTWLANRPKGLQLPQLRWVFFAGEPLSGQLVSQWRDAFSTAGQLVNLYGPTETTLAKCYYQVPEAPTVGIQPVGIPLPETQALIFSRSARLCGLGEVGEIVLRTPFRTLGYINASAKQQQQFRANPCREDSDDVLYYTGDLGRYRLDGSIEILGRADRQVKIRGVRIELGEVEARIMQHSAIRAAIVIAYGESNTKQLIAYVVPQSEQTVQVKELRQFLRQQLPEAMLPSAFVLLETLPLTPNGKIDRQALPAPTHSCLDTLDPSADSVDELELQLLQIWQQVLDISHIQVTDDFFDLGGHSLLAVQLFAEIEKTFGKKLPLATLFQASTVEEIAQIIRQKDWLAPWESLVAIKPSGTKPPLFYIHPGGGNLLVYGRDMAFGLGDDQPVYGLQSRGLDGNMRPSSSIEEMAEFYLSQIRSVQPQGPYHFAGLSSGGMIAWEMAYQLNQQGESVGLVALFDTSGPSYPKLLPVIPRLGSVLTWMGYDTTRRILKLPPKFFRVVKNKSWQKARLKLLRKFGLVKPNRNKEAQFEYDYFHYRVNKKLALHRQSLAQTRQVETVINQLITVLLSKSSCQWHANTFTSGLVREGQISVSPEIKAVNTANIKARKSYQPKPYEGKITLFRASERTPGTVREPTLGWQEFIAGELEIHEIPGNHVSIMNSAALVSCLRDCLSKAQIDY